MTWEGWTTVVVTVGIVVAMAFNVAAPDLLMLGALTLLLVLGIVGPADALAGFSNEAVLTVAALFVVAAGIRDTGGLDFLARRVLGRPRSLASAQLRLMTPVAAMNSRTSPARSSRSSAEITLPSRSWAVMDVFSMKDGWPSNVPLIASEWR